MKKSISIGINEKDREIIADYLSKLLADTYTLYLKTHYFHWNVKGPMFQTLHLMFEGQYNELAIAVDSIAERIRALGYPAPGTYSEFLTLTSIKESKSVPDALEMIRQLVDGQEAIIKSARLLLPIVNSVEDEVTSGLLAGRMETHEKTAWMLRSIIED